MKLDVKNFKIETAVVNYGQGGNGKIDEQIVVLKGSFDELTDVEITINVSGVNSRKNFELDPAFQGNITVVVE